MRDSLLHQRLLALVCLCFSQQVFCNLPTSDLLDLDLGTLMTLRVGASADASAQGLSAPLPGGQIAGATRLGILGTKALLDTPAITTSYTRDFIENRQAESIGDLLQYDPGIRVARGFGNFQQVYLVRGFPIFSDDMTYNGLYGILPRQYLAAELIERVEILRGTNAFVNAAPPGVSGSLGGAINAVPKRAHKQRLARVTLGTQSGPQNHAALDWSHLSANNHLGVRVNGVKRTGDTAITDEVRSLEMAILGVDFRVAHGRISADLGYQNHRLDATPPSLGLADGLQVPPPPDTTHTIAQPWTYSQERDRFGTLRAEYDLSPETTGWLAMGAREGKEDSIFSAFLTLNNPAGDFSGSRFDVIHQDSITTGELGLRTRWHTGQWVHQLTLSANHYNNDSRNAYLIYTGFTSNLYHPQPVDRPEVPVFAGGQLDAPLVTNSTETSSWALADEMTLLDGQLLVTLGLRRQNIREDNFDYGTGARQSRYHKHQLTPIAAAVYTFSSRYSGYLNYSEGLLKGEQAPLNNSRGLVSNGGESLAPYQTKQREAGVKYAGTSLGASVALFEIRKPLSGFNAHNALALIDYQRHRGLEFRLYGKLTPNINLLAGASLLDTRVRRRDAIGAPQLQSNLGLEWDTALQGLSLNSHWIYTGSQYADAGNHQVLPAWQRLDIGARYQFHWSKATQLTLHANLENLTGSHYWASAGGFPGTGYLTLGNPRRLVLSLSANF